MAKPSPQDKCPTCWRWIKDFDMTGCEAPSGQRWCVRHLIKKVVPTHRRIEITSMLTVQEMTQQADQLRWMLSLESNRAQWDRLFAERLMLVRQVAQLTGRDISGSVI